MRGDYENRLTQASLSGGVTVSYSYDVLGRRIQRTSTTGGTTKFIYDGADVVRDLDVNGATIADYLNGPSIDDKLRQTSGTIGSYFLTDHLGTTRALTDSTGNLTSSIAYDSFGNVTSGSASTRYSYTGREIDGDTGLMYYRARWYDAQVGRFISEDPTGLQGGMNLFAYVENNPLLLSDPSGLCPQQSSQQGDPSNICDTKVYWDYMGGEMKRIAKSVGGRLDEQNFVITGLYNVSYNNAGKRFQKLGGFSPFTSPNPNHPGQNFEKQINNERWYHVTVEPQFHTLTYPGSVTNREPVPDYQNKLPGRITMHCDQHQPSSFAHLRKDFFGLPF